MSQKTKKEMNRDIILMIITIIFFLLFFAILSLKLYQLKENIESICAKQNNTGRFTFGENYMVNCSQLEEIKNSEVAG